MPPELQSTSPTGRYELLVEPWEARNSHWVLSPMIRDTRTGKVFFKLQDSAWSAEKSTWMGEAEVRIELRKYPGDQPHPHIVVRLDCLREIACIDGGKAMPLNQVEQEAARALLGAA